MQNGLDVGVGLVEGLDLDVDLGADETPQGGRV